ncbi:ThuA domain-containing protein [Nonomuraea sp. NPDC048901]|uniref:ThuA domain-containing protein n=1 Tax=unclassified Nonomuraea TaxID=2593643 RepID=UPI00340A11AD
MRERMNVTVWNEFYEERTYPSVSSVYPDGLHVVLGQALAEHLGPEAHVRVALQEEPEHGLTQAVLDETDVLLWWGHLKHDEVSDEVVERVRRRVLGGMGLLILHSAIESKVAQALLGTSCKIASWRHDDSELLWTILPGHDIVRGVPNPVVIPKGEMYGEPMDIPEPDELVFISSYEGGEVLRSGCAWQRGKGRIFFFAPGHEESPIYFQPEIRRVLANAVQWATPPVQPQPKITRKGEWPRNWWAEA